MVTNPMKTKVAYLGPPSSYTHQVVPTLRASGHLLTRTMYHVLTENRLHWEPLRAATLSSNLKARYMVGDVVLVHDLSLISSFWQTSSPQSDRLPSAMELFLSRILPTAQSSIHLTFSSIWSNSLLPSRSAERHTWMSITASLGTLADLIMFIVIRYHFLMGQELPRTTCPIQTPR